MFKPLLTAILSFLISSILIAQANFPENGPLFIDTVVPRVDITINPDTLDWIYANPWSDIEFHADFVFDNGTVRDSIASVGFRLRGNTSRNSKKKSFKVSFNTFTSGGKYYGVEKLNLNGEHNDPSIMRSKMMWDILREWGIPAPRANHVQLYINNNYHGLYLNVEHIDEEFVESRFGNKDGNLYKCTWPADLAYLGSDPNVYKFESGSDRVYDLITNEEVDDYTNLASFIDVINHSPEADLVCNLNEIFNTYDYLKVIAADVFCGNWDGYIFNKNNFYLYENPATGKIEYIPYDVDNTFGIDWFNIDWGTKDIYSWEPGGSQQRPLYSQLINNPELRKQFTYYAKMLINTTIDIDLLIDNIEARKNMIAQYVVSDPYYPLDYGYTFNDFMNSYTQTIGAHVKYGLYPYLNTRSASMNEQLEQSTMDPVIKYIDHKRELGQQLWIKAQVEVEGFPRQVVVLYSLDSGDLQETEMLDIGNGIFTITLDNIPFESEVNYQIKVTDIIGKEQILPCQPVIVAPITGDKPLLFINEFMASNSLTIADEYGFYSDWVEIYNGDNDPVFLGDFYLTDNLDRPDKWKMPDVTLPVGGFELFWTDGDISLGDHHADFRLNKDGESLGIFNSELNVVDTLTFGQQTEDISYGRFPDGAVDWVFFNFPTPRASNIESTIGINEINKEDQLSVYPNPVNGTTIYLNNKIDCKIFNSSGVMVFEGSGVKSINISQFSRGLYLIFSETGLRSKFIIQ